MQINLQIHLHVDGTDLSTFISKLLALTSEIKSLDLESPQAAPEAPQATNPPTPSPAPQAAPDPPATVAAVRAVNPTTKRTANPPEKRPGRLPGETEKPRRMTSDRLPFEEFDQLVRSEMQRLNVDRRMPGHRLWDDQRDSRLPTLSAVLYRYNVTTLVDLAEELGMLPPLSAAPGVKVAKVPKNSLHE